MVLILSEAKDHTTNKVIEWLLHKNQKYIRLNISDEIKIIKNDDKLFLDCEFGVFNIDDIQGYWYRRGAFVFSGQLNAYPKELKNWFAQILSEDSKLLCEYLDFMLAKVPHINEFSKGEVNKLIVLELAKEIGLQTPETYLVNEIDQLNNLLTEKRALITKNLTSNSFLDNNISIMAYTQEIKEDVVQQLNNSQIFTSLVQKKIEKKFEIRTFFLEGSFFSMAIFSQSDEQTKIDFRNYNYKKPVRTTNFKLPSIVESKLVILMDKLGLNCGSIDLIVDINDNFVFLEVNPVGQFGMVSIPCNYYLEKLLANFLIDQP